MEDSLGNIVRSCQETKKSKKKEKKFSRHYSYNINTIVHSVEIYSVPNDSENFMKTLVPQCLKEWFSEA